MRELVNFDQPEHVNWAMIDAAKRGRTTRNRARPALLAGFASLHFPACARRALAGLFGGIAMTNAQHANENLAAPGWPRMS
jgi:hypothetical protein